MKSMMHKTTITRKPNTAGTIIAISNMVLAAAAAVGVVAVVGDVVGVVAAAAVSVVAVSVAVVDVVSLSHCRELQNKQTRQNITKSFQHK